MTALISGVHPSIALSKEGFTRSSWNKWVSAMYLGNLLRGEGHLRWTCVLYQEGS